MNLPVVPAAPSCPQCQRAAAPFLQAHDLNHRVAPATFQYWRCPACALVFLHPVPADLGRYYDVVYPPYSIPQSRADLDAAAARVRWRVEFVQRFVTAGRLLEIGPSYGAFAHAAAQAGFAVDAIELDARCSEFINRNVPGARAIATGNVVEALAQLPGPYDVIALWHNLEHLPDGFTVLARAVERLAAGGVLLVATPNPDSLQFRWFGASWVHLDAPRHVMLVPHGTLDAFLAARGLVRRELTTNDPDGTSLNRMSSDVSMAYALGLAERSTLRKYCSRLFRAIVRPLEKRGHRGTAYTAVYQKPAA